MNIPNNLDGLRPDEIWCKCAEKIAKRITKKLKKDIRENPEASLNEYRAGLYRAIEIVKEEGGIE